MTYSRLHATLLSSTKWKRASMAARGLWTSGASWCAGQLTDGLIPEISVKDIGGSDARIRSLVTAGLWAETTTEDGEKAYQFHDWLDHNESAVQLRHEPWLRGRGGDPRNWSVVQGRG